MGGADLNGSGGYQLLAPVIAVGFNGEWSHVTMNIEGMFDSAHKNNDGTGQNSGYTVRGNSSIYARFPMDIFIGGGIRYSDLHTDLYSKHAWRPTFGGGKDWQSPRFSCRATADYMLPGTDKLNGTQGAILSLQFPSPRSGRHFFYRQTLALYNFHNEDRHDRLVFSELMFTVGWRF